MLIPGTEYKAGREAAPAVQGPPVSGLDFTKKAKKLDEDVTGEYKGIVTIKHSNRFWLLVSPRKV